MKRINLSTVKELFTDLIPVQEVFKTDDGKAGCIFQALADKEGKSISEILQEFHPYYRQGGLWGWDGKTDEYIQKNSQKQMIGSVEFKLGLSDCREAWRLVNQ